MRGPSRGRTGRPAGNLTTAPLVRRRGQGVTRAMPVAQLSGVAMWYDERGSGEPAVLLHPGGAGVDSRALDPTADALSRVLHIYTPEQRAHGRTADIDGPVSYEVLA